MTKKTLDLSPAKWIWYPSERTLQNTFTLFRKEFNLDDIPDKAIGWIIADSRYQLFLNGERIQWGPAPSDPRWVEADPIDFTGKLRAGKNIIAIQVLFYGQGDGTWPVGKPGLLFNLQIEFSNGEKEHIISDSYWKVLLARSWQPGHYKRWYLRALQEEFDARIFPYGWNTNGFQENKNWLNAMIIDCPSDKPTVCSTYPEYLLDAFGNRETTELRKRSIPLMKESFLSVNKLTESFMLTWNRPINEYFEFLTPNSFSKANDLVISPSENGDYELSIENDKSAALTFEFSEQAVGWPMFTVEAPEGTVIELMVHEAHQPGGPLLLNTHFHAWARFICKEGVNHFETFDYECCRWLQLNIHNTHGIIKIFNIGMRRRMYPWKNIPKITIDESPLQKLFDASVNTLYNSAQDLQVDGMGRERQQYSGDCGHQIHAIYYSFGESDSIARYLNTYSQGLTLDGYFLDCWPAYDRLARLFERQLQLSMWGPLLDHGVGLNFDTYNYYMYTGNSEAISEVFPRLVRFFHYLISIKTSDGLLPVENIGIPSVWIDHDAFKQQRHKQCAFTLYASAMLENAFIPLCKVFKDTKNAKKAKKFSQDLLKSTIKKYWSNEHKTFINNLPWIDEEKEIRTCDRSLATALLFDQCPENQFENSLKILADCPPEMGFSYPANAIWRLWALAKYKRNDIVIKDLRERWSNMDSVLLNNTLQEYWVAKPDSESQWSHCPVVPLIVLFMNIAGIEPIKPGFSEFSINPQPGDIENLEINALTQKGPISFKSQGKLGSRKITIKSPKGTKGKLNLDSREKVNLNLKEETGSNAFSVYFLPAGKEIELDLKFT